MRIGEMMNRKNKGQNVIEYLLLVVAVVVVLLVFMNPQGGPMKNAMENIANGTVAGIDRLNKELKFGNASN
jgi:hypothetical protein